MRTFWNEAERTTKEGYTVINYEIESDEVLTFLEENGFGIFRPNRKKREYIQDQNNIVDYVDETDLTNYLRSYVMDINPKNVNDHKKLKNTVLNSRRLNANTYISLEEKNLIFAKDTAETAYLFYSNGFTVTTKDATVFKTYDQLDRKIWRDWQINREYWPTADRGDFERFIWQVATGERGEMDLTKDKRTRQDMEAVREVQCFETALGYLIHTYKNPGNVKSVVAFDDHDGEPDEADGRTGKSLLCKALDKIRRVVTFDGKNLNLAYTHVFDKIKFGDQIVNLNDVRKNFDFETLFHVLTEGFSIVPKGAAAFDIDFQDSPKVYISTNYTIQGSGGSALDRQHLLPFKAVYSSSYKPETFFKRLFFVEWDEKEWRRFDGYMHYCLRRFLQLGLVEVNTERYNERRAQTGTHPAMIEFCRNKIEVYGYGYRHAKNALYRDFCEFAKSAGVKELTPNKFSIWLKNAAAYLELKINAPQNGKRDRGADKVEYITFYEKNWTQTKEMFNH